LEPEVIESHLSKFKTLENLKSDNAISVLNLEAEQERRKEMAARRHEEVTKKLRKLTK